MPELFENMFRLTRERSTPQIIVNGLHIGGYEQLRVKRCDFILLQMCMNVKWKCLLMMTVSCLLVYSLIGADAK